MKKGDGLASFMFFLFGVIALSLGSLMYMSRAYVGNAPPENYIRAVGTIVALGEPEVGLPDDGGTELKPISLQPAVIEYQDADGKAHKSDGYVSTGNFRVGDHVPVDYDPNNPGSRHKMVSENLMAATWQFLFLIGVFLMIMAAIEVRAIRKDRGK